MVDGAGYLVIRDKEAGKPVDVIYPAEGTPLATGPSAVFKAAPNPNAARLFQNWMHGREGQQTPGRFRAAVFAAQAGGREARRPQARRHQADEGGSRRRREERRGDQAALRADLQGVTASDDRTQRQAMTIAAPARSAAPHHGFDLTKPVLYRLRGGAVRADRAADVVAGRTTASPTRTARSRSPISTGWSPIRPFSIRSSPPSSSRPRRR